MLTPTLTLLRDAQAGGYAIGAFNVYNLEGVHAVLDAAEAADSPVILQVHPGALRVRRHAAGGAMPGGGARGRRP